MNWILIAKLMNNIKEFVSINFFKEILLTPNFWKLH